MTHKEKKVDHSKELDELKEKYFRALADLDNMRKRNALEKDEIISFANERLICELLPIVDSFGRAFSSLESSEQNKDVVNGIALIKKQLEDTLSRAGVSPIEAIGKPFDPNFHEAIMKRKEEGKDCDMVIEVAQEGYTLKGKVIRPAMVIISE